MSLFTPHLFYSDFQVIADEILNKGELLNELCFALQ